MKTYITPSLATTFKASFVPVLVGAASAAAAATLLGVAQELIAGDNKVSIKNFKFRDHPELLEVCN